MVGLYAAVYSVGYFYFSCELYQKTDSRLCHAYGILARYGKSGELVCLCDNAFLSDIAGFTFISEKQQKQAPDIFCPDIYFPGCFACNDKQQKADSFFPYPRIYHGNVYFSVHEGKKADRLLPAVMPYIPDRRIFGADRILYFFQQILMAVRAVVVSVHTYHLSPLSYNCARFRYYQQTRRICDKSIFFSRKGIT